MKLLIVDDDAVTRNLLQEIFLSENYKVALAENAETAVKMLENENFEIVLSDIKMLDLDGMGLLKIIKEKAYKSVVILMTGFGSVESAVDAIKMGAFDYISKPYKIDEIKILVKKAGKHWNVIYSNEGKSQSVNKTENKKFPKTLIGKSPAIVDVYRMIAKASISNSPVIIQGEKGTGKALVAKSIHDNSIQKANKFYLINCDVENGKIDFSKINDAINSNGTIFLDEISEISSDSQIKLLDQLFDKENIRIISSTKTNIEELVFQKKFREDLFYKLNVISITLPPLRERKEDLQDLVDVFIKRYSNKNNKIISHISEDVIDAFKRYSWPGNVQELEYAIEKAIALSSSSILYKEDFPSEIFSANIFEIKQVSSELNNHHTHSLEEIEKQHILKVLHEVEFNKSKAAAILGIDRATLYRKAAKFGIILK